jgi:hypothetical protein
MLDNIPLIHFAFPLAEFIILTLGTLFCVILCFHRNRIILLRRFFAITATVFLLRCVTMFVTSLSVPGVHLKCDVRVGASMEEKLDHAWRIMRGLALSINGLRTCGDYMFRYSQLHSHYPYCSCSSFFVLLSCLVFVFVFNFASCLCVLTQQTFLKWSHNHFDDVELLHQRILTCQL